MKKTSKARAGSRNSGRRIWLEKFPKKTLAVVAKSAVLSAALVLIISLFLVFSGLAPQLVLLSIFPAWLLGTAMVFATVRHWEK